MNKSPFFSILLVFVFFTNAFSIVTTSDDSFADTIKQTTVNHFSGNGTVSGSFAQAAPGSLDTTFGSGGIVLSDFKIVNKILVQNDGKIIVAGMSLDSSALIARYNPNGQLDSGFGVGGKVILQPGSSALDFRDAALQSDGKIVAVSFQYNLYFNTHRYNSDGTPDTGFGDGGTVRTVTRDGQATYTRSVAIQNDGKILVGGTSGPSKAPGLRLIRYNSNGSFDTDLYIIGPNGRGVYKIVVQPDGKILISSGDLIRRLNPNGSLDTTFGNNGVIDSQINRFGKVTLALQLDGKIVVAGSKTVSDGNTTRDDFAVARFNADGTPDSSFGTNGVVQTKIGSGNSVAVDVAIQKNGKIVAVGGSSINSTVVSFVTVRYTASGSLDTGFGNGGIETLAASGRADTVAIQPDGKIIVAGFSGNDPILARYLGDAVNSTSRFDFDGDGKSDISVFRPSNGIWYFLNSLNGFSALPFGLSQDQIAAADFDGDRKTDIAVFRPSNGEWTVLNSSDNTYRVLNFGQNGDVPRPGDFDGDGRADIAVYRPSNGFWYWLQSSDGNFRFAQFGQNGDLPLLADFDNDGKSDLALYRPSNGFWYWVQSSDQSFNAFRFGLMEDIPVPADYDGDGKSDIAVFRPSNGVWYLQRSQAGFLSVAFGFGTDLPIPADYDGDGRADISVFRPSNGVWYFLQSANNNFNAVQFGFGSDKPIPFAFAPQL